MLLEQYIEFELRGPGPCGRPCTFTTDYFHDKTKFYKENLQVDYCLLLKYCKRQCTLVSSTWANSFINLPPKCKILNVFWA